MQNKTLIILIGFISSLIVIGLMVSLAVAIFTQNIEAVKLISDNLNTLVLVVTILISLYFIKK